MAKGFDWNKLPKERIPEVWELLQGERKKDLIIIHNEYSLSGFDYGCCGGEALLDRFNQAFKSGKLKL